MKTEHLTIMAAWLLLASAQDLMAQQVQLPLFGQYRENQSILNPAALNIDYIRNGYNFSAGVSYRNQWGAADLVLDNGKTEHFGPRTLTARAEWIVPESRLLLGAHFMKDDAFALRLQGAYLRVGYFVLDPQTSAIGLVGSIGGGFNSFRSDLNQVDIIDFNTQYTLVGESPDFQLNYWDITLGLFGWGEVLSGPLEGDIFYGGISIPQFQGLPLDEVDATTVQNGFEVQEGYTQISVVAGIYKYIGEESFIEGSLNFTHLLKSKSPKVITPNIRWHYKDIAWFGAGARLPFYQRTDESGVRFDDLIDLRELAYYRTSTILIDVGFNIGKNLSYSLEGQNIKVGIGYEIPFGKLLRTLGNTIELNLTYTLDTGGGRR